MNQRRKEKAFDIFYNEFKMLEKFNYIKKVMKSCKSSDQLNNALTWGRTALWNWFHAIENKYSKKYDSFKWLDIWHYTFDRTDKLVDELLKYYRELL